MTAATAQAPETPRRLLDTIERVGNGVPHPVLMFLYLIIGVIVLSAILRSPGVSVTEQIAVPDAVGVPPNYYEDTTYPIMAPGRCPTTATRTTSHLEEVTIPIRSLLSSRGHPLHLHVVRGQLHGLRRRRHHVHRDDGRGRRRGGGLMAALIRQLVKVSPRRLLAFILIFVGVLSSIATDAGYLILVPLGAAAFLSVGRHPLAGMAACFAGVGAIFGVNLIISPSTRMITEITNEAIGAAGSAPLTILANYCFSIVSSIVLAIVAALVTERIDRAAAGHVRPLDGRWTGGDLHRGRSRLRHDPAAEQRGLRFALIAFAGFLGLAPAVTLPRGRPAPRPGDRRHHRQHPVHGQPDLHHLDDVPGRGHRLRHGARNVHEQRRRHRGRDEDLRRAGGPGLHAADDQPVHRLLQLQQHAERHRDRARGVAGKPRASGPCRC